MLSLKALGIILLYGKEAWLCSQGNGMSFGLSFYSNIYKQYLSKRRWLKERYAARDAARQAELDAAAKAKEDAADHFVAFPTDVSASGRFASSNGYSTSPRVDYGGKAATVALLYVGSSTISSQVFLVEASWLLLSVLLNVHPADNRLLIILANSAQPRNARDLVLKLRMHPGMGFMAAKLS